MTGLMPKGPRDARLGEKRAAIASWLAVHRFSSRQIVEALLRIQRNAAHKTLAAMVKDELIRSYPVAFAGGRVTVYGLTAHGQTHFNPDDTITRDWSSADRAAPGTILHSLAVQATHLQLLNMGYTNLPTPHQLITQARMHRDIGLQTPDLLATQPDGALCAIEVERWYKNPARYRAIVAGYLRMIKAKTISRVLYVAAAPCSPARFQKTIASLGYVMVAGRKHPVTAEHLAHFSFLQLMLSSHVTTDPHPEKNHHNKTVRSAHSVGAAQSP